MFSGDNVGIVPINLGWSFKSDDTYNTEFWVKMLKISQKFVSNPGVLLNCCEQVQYIWNGKWKMI